jgi:membrane protease YdiL (CAAX protease family)
MRRIFLAFSIFSILLFLATFGCQIIGTGACSFLSDNAIYIGSGAIHLGLLSIAMLFLWKGDLRSTLEGIGFPGKLKTVIGYTAGTLFSMFVLLFILGLVAVFWGFNDQEKVSDKITGLPLPILLFAALVAPVTEELFFRGLLTPRIGVVFSSVVFGILHFSYGSNIEVLGTFAVGLVLGTSFKLSKSITPCILSHMAYNMLAIIVMKVLT